DPRVFRAAIFLAGRSWPKYPICVHARLLRPYLSDPSPEVRCIVVDLLDLTGDARPILLSTLKDVDPRVRYHSIQALAKIRIEPSMDWNSLTEQHFWRAVDEEIVEALSDIDDFVRRAAIDALNPNHAVRQVVDILIANLADPNVGH